MVKPSRVDTIGLHPQATREGLALLTHPGVRPRPRSKMCAPAPDAPKPESQRLKLMS